MGRSAIIGSYCCCPCAVPTCDASCVEATTLIAATFNAQENTFEESRECPGTFVYGTTTGQASFDGLCNGKVTAILDVDSPRGSSVNEYSPPFGNPYSEGRFFGGARISASGDMEWSHFNPLPETGDTIGFRSTGDVNCSVRWENLDSNTDSNFVDVPSQNLRQSQKKRIADYCDDESICVNDHQTHAYIQVLETKDWEINTTFHIWELEPNDESWSTFEASITYTSTRVFTLGLGMTVRWPVDLKDCTDVPSSQGNNPIAVGSEFGISEYTFNASQEVISAVNDGDPAFDTSGHPVSVADREPFTMPWYEAIAFSATHASCVGQTIDWGGNNPVVQREDPCEPEEQGTQGRAVSKETYLASYVETAPCDGSVETEFNNTVNHTNTLMHNNRFPLVPLECP